MTRSGNLSESAEEAFCLDEDQPQSTSGTRTFSGGDPLAGFLFLSRENEAGPWLGVIRSRFVSFP